MKLFAFVSAGLIAAAALAPAPLAARWNHSWHGWHWRTVCRYQWHHHHHVRQCTRVRVRR